MAAMRHARRATVLGCALLAVFNVFLDLHKLSLRCVSAGERTRAAAVDNRDEIVTAGGGRATSRIIQCASRRLRTFTRSPEADTR
jgi:hypothetical protein